MESKNIINTLLFAAMIVVVMGLGIFAGWFVFLKSKTTNETARDALVFDTPAQSGFAIPTGTAVTPRKPVGAVQTATTTKQLPRVWHIDTRPIAGFGFATSGLVYIPRVNGNVFVADVFTQTSSRLSDKTFPMIYDALVAYDGSVIMRSQDTTGIATTFLGTLTTVDPTRSDATTTAHSILSGVYGPRGITSIGLNPKTRQYVYTLPAREGVNVYTQNWGDTQGILLTSQTTPGWTVSVIPDGRVLLSTRPADDLVGYSYTVDTKGTTKTFVRNITGLSVLPESGGDGFIYSSSQNGRMQLLFATSSRTGIIEPLSSIADKCAWAPQTHIAYCAVPQSLPTAFINSWYQGTVHTQDTWWQLSDATATRVYNPVVDNISFDVDRPQVDPTGTYIVFKDHTDESLWALRITE
jgi:hypothetical protein